MANPFIHPRLFEQLADFYPDFCNIQEASSPQDTTGQPIVSAWADKPGHTGIRCRRSPTSAPGISTERKRSNVVFTVATHAIELAGYYPGIREKMRAVVAGQAFDIVSVESDGNSAMTRLVCQVVR